MSDSSNHTIEKIGVATLVISGDHNQEQKDFAYNGMRDIFMCLIMPT
jgi:hypothetical protein